jgi:hypothetical protein
MTLIKIFHTLILIKYHALMKQVFLTISKMKKGNSSAIPVVKKKKKEELINE